jgi:hypothetical protein
MRALAQFPKYPASTFNPVSPVAQRFTTVVEVTFIAVCSKFEGFSRNTALSIL